MPLSFDYQMIHICLIKVFTTSTEHWIQLFFFSQNAQNETRIRNFYHGIYFIFVWNKWMFFFSFSCCRASAGRLYGCIDIFMLWMYFFTWDYCITALQINIDNYCVIINYIWPFYANLGFPFKWSKSQLNEVRKRERAK